MDNIPTAHQKFKDNYPEIFLAYENLGKAVHELGALDEKTRALIKLAISTGAKLEGAIHSHTKKAINLGLSPEEIRQTILLALPTIGLPSTIAAMSWVDDILENK